MIKTIDQFQLHEKKVFIRADFNLSIKDGVITDDTRLKESLPTIEYSIKQGAKVILSSHLGRPKGKRDEKYSLMPVAELLSAILKKDILFPEDCIGDAARKLALEMRAGDVMLLENLRFHEEEEANDENFSKKLAGLAEVYINDAFGTAHRAHASTFGMVPFFKEKGMGLLMQKEVKCLSQLLQSPAKPFVVVLGGAKVSDKIEIIENLLGQIDALCIGGGMAYTFLKAMGKDIGRSLLEESKINQAKRIIKRTEEKGIPLLLPVDSVLTEKLEGKIVYHVQSTDRPWGNEMGVDIGPETVKVFAKHLREAKTIFWNGPMGIFEMPPFDQGTFEVTRIISEVDCFSIVGGGDSLAAIMKTGLSDHFTHLSTGGGASMEFLAGKTLPGITAL